MQSVQGSQAMTTSGSSLPSSTKAFIKWALLASVAIINGYATVLMYSRGETAFALLTVVLTALALYIFGSKKTYAHRYIYPGIAGMILFIIFPLVYTVGLSLTNYSSTNQLSFERAQSVLLERTFQGGDSYPFSLYQTDKGARLVVEMPEARYATKPFDFAALPAQTLALTPVDSISGEKATLRAVIQNRDALSALELKRSDDQIIRMSGLKEVCCHSTALQPAR